ncbi:Spy/CpxP family protein refolding chaperone [uncultured Devosia sp.]|uniref:Spy/CpxP family protein refolding chaperone n=1 Tax=uncultured Devosia sp. TaxID=211434 RepID=UPI0035CA8BFA
MKTISTTAIIAVMTATIGFSAVAPVMAQQADQPSFGQFHQQRGDGPNVHQQRGNGPDRHAGNPGGRRGAGMLGQILDFGRGGENLEIALVRLSHRIDLTDEQKTLLETLKTDALAAQASFAGVVDATRPAAPSQTAQRPDMVEQLDQRIALENAHVDALTAVQPAFEAFFASLSDEQKAQLMPQRERHMGMNGRPDMGPGQHHRPRPGMMAPATPPAPPAPEAPAAADPAAIDG